MIVILETLLHRGSVLPLALIVAAPWLILLWVIA